MRKLAFLVTAFALVTASFYGCDETTPAEPATAAEAATPLLDRQSNPIGALRRIAHEYEGHNGTLAAGAYVEVQVTCPDGLIALGGGGTAVNTEWVLQKSRPGNYLNGVPTAWWAGFKNVGAGTESSYYEAQVICAVAS